MSERYRPEPVSLPSGFDDLARFQEWMIPNDLGRIERRLSLPFAEVKAFYDQIMPDFDRILRYLHTRPPTEISQGDANLLNLALSVVEVSNAVEVYEEGGVTDGGDLRSFASIIDVPVQAGSAV